MASRKSVAAAWLTTLLAGTCGAALAGCGQKGPLTLPAAAAAATPATAASAPAPAR
jgi:predicted small lipoprotein YifL